MSLPTLTSERLWLATFERLSSDFRATLAGDYRLSGDFPTMTSDFPARRSATFQRLSSDYDRPPSFRVEVRRFSDLLTGWRGWRLADDRLPVLHGLADQHISRFYIV